MPRGKCQTRGKLQSRLALQRLLGGREEGYKFLVTACSCQDGEWLSGQESWLTLAVGDTICVHYNNKKYYIDITEAKPQDAISVIETDCEVRLRAWVWARCSAATSAVGLCAVETGA